VDVLGEVQKRGPVYLQGPTSLVEVISAAGGPSAENVVEVEVVSAGGASRTYDLHALTAAQTDVSVQPGDRIVLKPGKVVYVEGQLKRPGEVLLRDGLTVTQALALAGGPEEFANLRRVLVRRADGSQELVNVPRVHKGLAPDPVLRSDDHIVVPRGSY
jgi:polysaccharide export outer membrane protein